MNPHTLVASAEPWCIAPGHAALAFSTSSAAWHEPPRPRAVAGRRQPATASEVAVIPIFGILTPRGGRCGFTSTAALAQHARLADADPAVHTILLDVDSPGGSVFGVQELADTLAEIRAAGRTRVVAVANAIALCGAYWIASQAQELVITPSGMVGGIGAVTGHTDTSAMQERMGVKTEYIAAGRFKSEGYSTVPLGKETRVYLQRQVNTVESAFVAAVARGRNVPEQKVRGPQFGEGRVRLADEAVRYQLADRVGTLEQTLQRILGTRTSRPPPSSALAASREVLRRAMARPATPGRL